MNKKIKWTALGILLLALLLLALPASAEVPDTEFAKLYFGEVILSGGITNGHFPNLWSISPACPMTLRAKIDLSEVVRASNTFAWTQIGVRAYSLADYNPDDGVWLLTDANVSGDKLLLQNVTGRTETAYDLPAGTTDSITPLWFDPAATEGVYELVLKLTADDAGVGSAYLNIRGVDQVWEGTTTLAGLNFTSSNMHALQVFYGLFGDPTQTVKLSDIYTSGCIVLEEGMVNGGGAFYAEDHDELDEDDGITPFGKATFAFVAKRKDSENLGQLKFVYELDNLRLESTSYDWVAISWVQGDFEGVGTLNGVGEYRFRVRAVDGDKLSTGTDRFEIRIWTDGSDWDHPVHRAEGYVTQGQIVVHKK